MSWKPEVIADSSGKWTSNALRFATKAEAEANARDLANRWTAVRDHRATESSDPVNYRWVDGKLVKRWLSGADLGNLALTVSPHELDTIVAALEFYAREGGDLGDLEIAEIRELANRIAAIEAVKPGDVA